jgi:hypothetical protein
VGVGELTRRRSLFCKAPSPKRASVLGGEGGVAGVFSVPELVRMVVLGMGKMTVGLGLVQLTDYGRCVATGCGCRGFSKTKVNMVCACGHRRERHVIVH